MICEHCGQRIVKINGEWQHDETGSERCYADPPRGYETSATPEFGTYTCRRCRGDYFTGSAYTDPEFCEDCLVETSQPN